MICIRPVTRLSNVKWALTQTQGTWSNKLFLVEKLRKFLILFYIFINVLFCKLHIKTPWYSSWRSIDFWGTFESNFTFHQKLESIQFNACLVLSGDIRESSIEKLYQKLGLESLQRQRWYKKLCLFQKILKKTNQFTFLMK